MPVSLICFQFFNYQPSRECLPLVVGILNTGETTRYFNLQQLANTTKVFHSRVKITTLHFISSFFFFLKSPSIFQSVFPPSLVFWECGYSHDRNWKWALKVEEKLKLYTMPRKHMLLSDALQLTHHCPSGRERAL